MDASIIANGTIGNGAWLRRNLAGIIIAADGAADTCLQHRVIPDFVIGDFDSIRKKTLAALRRVSTILPAPDQNQTDLQKSLAFAKTLGATRIFVFGGIGDELDHTFANLLTLDPACVMLDEKHDIRIVDKKFTFEGKRGDLVSIIALTPVRGLTYRGLRWPVKSRSVPAGWIGIRNRLLAKKGSVSVTSGRIALIRFHS